MGDRRKQALRVQFDGKLKLEFHAAKITSDAGLLPFRELDEECWDEIPISSPRVRESFPVGRARFAKAEDAGKDSRG